MSLFIPVDIVDKCENQIAGLFIRFFGLHVEYREIFIFIIIYSTDDTSEHGDFTEEFHLKLAAQIDLALTADKNSCSVFGDILYNTAETGLPFGQLS